MRCWSTRTAHGGVLNGAGGKIRVRLRVLLRRPRFQKVEEVVQILMLKKKYDDFEIAQHDPQNIEKRDQFRLTSRNSGAHCSGMSSWGFTRCTFRPGVPEDQIEKP